MADFNTARPWVLSHEVIGWPMGVNLQDAMDHVKAMSLNSHNDDRLWFTNDPDDPGGATAWGITLGEAQAHGILTAESLKDLDAAGVQAIYGLGYWHFNGVVSQAIATKLFDLCVNMGTGSAVKLVQELLNGLGAALVEDGGYGPRTEAAINAVEPSRLMGLICQAATEHYRAIVDHHPASQKFLAGWVRRAQDIPA